MKNFLTLITALFLAALFISCQKEDGVKPQDGLYVCNVVNNKPSHLTTISFKDGAAYEFRYYRSKGADDFVSIPVGMKGSYPKYTLFTNHPSVKSFDFMLGFLVHNQFSATFLVVFEDGDETLSLPAQEWRYVLHDSNLDKDGDGRIDLYTK